MFVKMEMNVEEIIWEVGVTEGGRRGNICGGYEVLESRELDLR